MRHSLQAVTLIFVALTVQASSVADRAVQAIYDNNIEQLKQYFHEGGAANARSGRENTLLMYAAAYGTADTVKLLLAHGADVNLKNAFDATALMWAVSDPEKVRVLLKKGADPNAQSKSKRTPLLLAALDANAGKSVELLARSGADFTTKDSFGYTILSAGSFSGNAEAVRLGLAHHIDVNAQTRIGGTALTLAAIRGSVEFTKLLLAAGADPNHVTMPAGPQVKSGTVSLGRFTALILAAAYAPPELTRLLLDHGAKVDFTDDRGMTALHAAVSSEARNDETIKLLLAKGADASFQNARGESAVDWARKFRRSSVSEMLHVSQAQEPGLPVAESLREPLEEHQPLTPAKAYAKSMLLLETTSGNFLSKGGCIACHAQNITGMAAAAGPANGLPPTPKTTEERLRVTRLSWASQPEGLLLREDGPGGAANVAASLLAMAAEGYQPDLLSAAMARNCAVQQDADGAWRRPLSLARVPSEDSAIGLTAEVVHALAQFGGGGTHAEYAKRIERARQWLLAAKPSYEADANFLVLGLKWAGASNADVAKAARRVAAAQRPSGGWGQNSNLPDDAYATGQALYALHEAGTPATSPAFGRGIAYLLRTQAADGSWHVMSRAVKFQPYFQSGFPYDHDQWISMAGTAWASMAMAISAGAEKSGGPLSARLQ